MKVIDIKNQVSLPFAKCIELVLSGIKYRLFRAAITVSIIALAVAFLMTMLTESFIARRVAEEIQQRTAPRKAFDFWVSRISSPLTPGQLTLELASGQKGGPRWKEFLAWGKLTDPQIQKLANIAQRQVAYGRFFSELEEGELRPMVGRVRGEAIFQLLQDQQAYQQFEDEFRTLGKQMHTGLEEFKTFLADWQGTATDRLAILAGNNAALEIVKARFGDLEAKNVLANADEKLLQLLSENNFHLSENQANVVRQQASLAVDAETMVSLLGIEKVKNKLAYERSAELTDVDTPMFFSEIGSSKGAQWLKDLVAELSEGISRLEVELPKQRAEVAKLSAQAEELEDSAENLKNQLEDQQESLRSAESSGNEQDIAQARLAIDKAKQALEAVEKQQQELLEGERDERGNLVITGLNDKKQDLKRAVESAKSLFPARGNIESFTLTPDRIKAVAQNRNQQRKLATVETTVRRSAGTEGGFLGYSSRTMWLITVSFLVCVVGIANAMLMSVTDRFREIATMKCLGATDGYIMTNFILESCLQGTAGGIIGAILGFLLGSLRSLFSYGWISLQHMPVGLVLTTAAVSLVVGVILSALAAVYPAWIAARLAPMEAMRIE